MSAMRFPPILLGLAAAVVAAACSPLGPNGDSNQQALVQVQRNQASWDSLALRYYDFRYAKLCACPSATGVVDVHVRNGAVVSVTDTTGLDVTEQPGMEWPTVDSLFARARAVLANPGLTTLLEFNVQYHYPAVVESFETSTGKLVRHTASDLAPAAIP